jgi:hypothetical protein
MKKGNSKPLTPELQAELDALVAMPESEIDTAEMPPVTDWSHAVRGRFTGPSSARFRCASMPIFLTGFSIRARVTRRA